MIGARDSCVRRADKRPLGAPEVYPHELGRRQPDRKPPTILAQCEPASRVVRPGSAPSLGEDTFDG